MFTRKLFYHITDIFVSHWLGLSGTELLLEYVQLRITSRCQFVFNYYLLVDVWALNGVIYLDRLFKICHIPSTDWFLFYLYFIVTICSLYYLHISHLTSFIPLLLLFITVSIRTQFVNCLVLNPLAFNFRLNDESIRVLSGSGDAIQFSAWLPPKSHLLDKICRKYILKRLNSLAELREGNFDRCQYVMHQD